MRSLHSELHIVVVDSRPSDYHELSTLASDQKWHLHLLTTVRAAVQLVRRIYADLWVINTRLPDMSGFTLHETLCEQLSAPPAVIISDEYELEDERRACCGGAILYLCKSPSHTVDGQLIVALLTSRREIAGLTADPIVNSLTHPVVAGGRRC